MGIAPEASSPIPAHLAPMHIRHEAGSASRMASGLPCAPLVEMATASAKHSAEVPDDYWQLGGSAAWLVGYFESRALQGVVV